MKTKVKYIKTQPIQDKIKQSAWQHFMLLIVLGYEASGCLLGGTLLVLAPDGRYLKMPVDLMHGAFSDFLVPGMILFGLGILNLLAFIFVIQRAVLDWLMAGIALGGLLIWFIVEIIILQELHWLHAMWGLPVLLGWGMIVPLIIWRRGNQGQ